MSVIRYDDNGNPNRPTATINALGQRTDTKYDTFGQVISIQFPRTDPTYPAVGEDAASAAKKSTGRLATVIAYDYSDPLCTLPVARFRGRRGCSALGERVLSFPRCFGLIILLATRTPVCLSSIAGPDSRALPPNATEFVPVTTRLAYTPLGNVAALSLPAPKEISKDSRALATVAYAYSYAVQSETHWMAIRRPRQKTNLSPALTPSRHITRWRWDAAGNCIAVIDANGARTDYAYDDLGTSELYPLSRHR